MLSIMRCDRTSFCCRYENVVQVRCLLEGVPVEDILADWHGLLAHYMQQWQLDRSEVGDSMM